MRLNNTDALIGFEVFDTTDGGFFLLEPYSTRRKTSHVVSVWEGARQDGAAKHLARCKYKRGRSVDHPLSPERSFYCTFEFDVDKKDMPARIHRAGCR